MDREETGKLDRMQWSILGLSAVAAAVLGWLLGVRWGIGTLTGGVVGYLNFRWLRFTVERMLGEGRGKGAVVALYMFKLAALAAVLATLVFVFGVPPVSLLAGLGAMPAGILGEPLVRLMFPGKRLPDA